MWDYSIRFGSDRYLFHVGIKPLVFGSTGKELLWRLPYLIPGKGIFGVRLWNALIKIIPHMFLGFLLVFDYKGIKSLRWERLLFGFWASLFLLQGSVQPALIVSVIITVAFVRKKYTGGGRDHRNGWNGTPGIYSNVMMCWNLLQR